MGNGHSLILGTLLVWSSGVWTYDAVGNWSEFKAVGWQPAPNVTDAEFAGNPVVTDTRTHDAAHRITARSVKRKNVGQPQQTTNHTLSYDDAGNLADDGSFEFVYDEENRLAQVKRSSATGRPDAGALLAEYIYDPLGRRLAKRFRITDAAAWTYRYYTHDGDRIVEETDGANLRKQYVWGVGIDELLYVQEGATRRFFAHNSNGNVAALLDETGKVIERYEYDPYGNVEILATDAQGNPTTRTNVGSAYGNPWLFTGRYFDEETGLYHYRARHYSSVLGRFLQRDPAGYPQDRFNPYEYVGSRPTIMVDPTGMYSWRAFASDVGDFADGVQQKVNKVRATVSKAIDATSAAVSETWEGAAMLSGARGQAAENAAWSAWNEGVVEGMDNVENAANSARRWAKRKAGRYQSHAARGDWGAMGSQIFDDTADAVYGAGDVLTFGGSKSVRTNVMGEVEYRDAGMYVGGQVAGVALGMAVGNYAGMPACQTANYLAQANAIGRGASAVNALRIAKAYTLVESGVAMAQASAKIMSDEPVGLSDLASFAPLAGYALNRVGSHLTGDICFVAGTKVLTPEGRRNIEDISPGDVVDSANHITGRRTTGVVVRTFVTFPTQLNHVRYRPTNVDAGSDEHELLVTAEHPFAVPAQNPYGFDWKPAGDLTQGDRVILSDGTRAEIVANTVEHAAPGTTFTTYNFEVAEQHTYFAAPGEIHSAPAVWVHNTGRRCTPSEYVKHVVGKPGKKRRVDTSWTHRGPSGRKVGYRELDHFDRASQTGFEMTLLEWSTLKPGSDRYRHKLAELAADIDLLQGGDVRRIRWIGTEPLPESGPLAQLWLDMRDAQRRGLDIRYYVVPKP